MAIVSPSLIVTWSMTKSRTQNDLVNWNIVSTSTYNYIPVFSHNYYHQPVKIFSNVLRRNNACMHIVCAENTHEVSSWMIVRAHKRFPKNTLRYYLIRFENQSARVYSIYTRSGMSLTNQNKLIFMSMKRTYGKTNQLYANWSRCYLPRKTSPTITNASESHAEISAQFSALRSVTKRKKVVLYKRTISTVWY